MNNVGGYLSRTEAPDGVIQGKFGFEMETGIRASAVKLSKIQKDGTVRDKDYKSATLKAVKQSPILGKTDFYTAHLDHNQQKDSIIEFVTNPPFDEFTHTKEYVAETMKKMADSAKKIATEVNSGPKPLSKYMTSEEATDWKLYAGAPNAVNQSATAYAQCTFGVKVKNIPEMYQDFYEKKMYATTTDAKNINDAVQGAQKVIEKVNDYIHTVKGDSKALMRSNPDDLKGFITLIMRNIYSAYNTISTENRLSKNKMGQLFNKTPLNMIPNELSDGAKACLKDHALCQIIKNGILKYIILKPDDPFLHNTSIGSYIDDVLNGKEDSDSVLKIGLNKWSEPIIDKIGPNEEMAVIMENRRIHPKRTLEEMAKLIEQGVNLRFYPPDKWASLAEKYYDYLQFWNK